MRATSLQSSLYTHPEEMENAVPAPALLTCLFNSYCNIGVSKFMIHMDRNIYEFRRYTTFIFHAII